MGHARRTWSRSSGPGWRLRLRCYAGREDDHVAEDSGCAVVVELGFFDRLDGAVGEPGRRRNRPRRQEIPSPSRRRPRRHARNISAELVRCGYPPRRPSPRTGRRRPSRHPERALITVPTPGTGSGPIIRTVGGPTRPAPYTPLVAHHRGVADRPVRRHRLRAARA